MSLPKHKKKGRRSRPQGQKPESAENQAILELVRNGVRRFILNGARIAEFQSALKVLSRKGKQSHHPLTGTVFRRIVQEAIRERRRKSTRKRDAK